MNGKKAVGIFLILVLVVGVILYAHQKSRIEEEDTKNTAALIGSLHYATETEYEAVVLYAALSESEVSLMERLARRTNQTYSDIMGDEISHIEILQGVLKAVGGDYATELQPWDQIIEKYTPPHGKSVEGAVKSEEEAIAMYQIIEEEMGKMDLDPALVEDISGILRDEEEHLETLKSFTTG